ncbi:Chlorovirus glycoprotein repeat domain-containing protein [Acanthocystis turfacea Chlorella virus MN0810.1]|nr:Chlorovirus glycoprotein repeat domain-containing protein [Acanthocystis turfacea Chlorella virus MN0810.1]
MSSFLSANPVITTALAQEIEIGNAVIGNLTVTEAIIGNITVGNITNLNVQDLNVANLKVTNNLAVMSDSFFGGNTLLTGQLRVLGTTVSSLFSGNGAGLTDISPASLPDVITSDILGNVTGSFANVLNIDTTTGTIANVAFANENVIAPGTVLASFIKASDAFYMSKIAGTPILSFDDGDYFEYSRPDKKLNLIMEGNTVARFDNQGNLTMLGNVAGRYFKGNGALLTGVTSTLPGAANIDIVGNVTAPGDVVGAVIKAGTEYYMQLPGGNPVLNFDISDYFQYTRATNTLDLTIASNNVAKFDSQGNLTMLGNVAGRYFKGNGALLTGVTSTLPGGPPTLTLLETSRHPATSLVQ